MKKIKTFSIALPLVVMLFSCTKQVKNNITLPHKIPLAVAENFTLIYTDSTKTKAILKSPINENFTNQGYPYHNFPKGVYVEVFDKDKNKTTISAKYAIQYPWSNIIEFKDSVVIETYDQRQLKTNRLIWSGGENWVFTPEEFTYTDKKENSITKGVGMDFNKDFTQLKAYKITGVIPIKE